MDNISTILELFKQKGELSPDFITKTLGISRQAVNKHLNSLIKKGTLKKTGKAPRVYYSLNEISKSKIDSYIIDSDVKNIIDENFLYISPVGEAVYGFDGFVLWCKSNNKDVLISAYKYISKIHLKKDFYKLNKRLYKNFSTVYLDNTYFYDFLEIPDFDRTKIGSLLIYAKHQNYTLIEEITKMLGNKLKSFIKEQKFDAIGFIPPSVQRNLQFQKEFMNLLNLSLPHINIKKISNKISIPQKDLINIQDRVANAKNTIFVDLKHPYENVLLIDDEIVTGSTLNETARKLKEKGVNKVSAFAIVAGPQDSEYEEI